MMFEGAQNIPKALQRAATERERVTVLERQLEELTQRGNLHKAQKQAEEEAEELQQSLRQEHDRVSAIEAKLQALSRRSQQISTEEQQLSEDPTKRSSFAESWDRLPRSVGF